MLAFLNNWPSAYLLTSGRVSLPESFARQDAGRHRQTRMALCKRHSPSELNFPLFPVETIRPVQIARSRFFIPEIIDSATSMG
jgi:hypothetical protein